MPFTEVRGPGGAGAGGARALRGSVSGALGLCIESKRASQRGLFPSAGSDVAKGKRAKGGVREQRAPRGPRRARTVDKSRRKCADRSDNYENPRTLQCTTTIFFYLF